MVELKSFCICLLSVLLLKIDPSVQDLTDIMAYFESMILKSDTYLFVGEELNVPCKLGAEMLQNGHTSQDIFFTFVQPKKAYPRPVCVNSSLVRVLDASTAVLSIRNVTLNEDGLFVCYVSHDNCSSLENTTGFWGETAIGFTDDIIIQYKPQNVTDFKCIIYDWNGHMKCTWTHPVPYVEDYGDSDTFVAIKEGELGNLTFCPINDSVSCLWPKGYLMQKDTYYITVEVWNAEKAIHTSQVFTVRADQIVQPAPVKNIRAKTLSDRCLKLSWTHGSNRAKVCRITQQKDGDPGHKVVTDNETHTIYKVCDYEPSAVYTFAVDCHPLGLGYWSNPRVFHVLTTPKSASRSGLVIAEGSYDTATCIAELRNINLHWQEVDKLYKNGIIDSYSVKINSRVLARIPDGNSESLKMPGTCVNAVAKTVLRG